ncbi:MAG TPA: hypothetical protein VN953_09475 [Gemmatimonadales bacterium]|nr:hypothetical protein [Gemmatimonadales bacterium]
MHRWLIAVTAVVGMSSGCYFRAMLDEPPVPNTSVTVTLTSDGAETLSDPLGPGARELDGRLLSSAPDTVALAVYRMTRVGGRIEPWKGEHVAMPRRAVARLERRWFSPFATAVVVGGAVTGLVLAAHVVGRAPVLH